MELYYHDYVWSAGHVFILQKMTFLNLNSAYNNS